MTKIKDVLNYLEEIAPFEYQENYDNAGLIVGDPYVECTGVITCLDSTEDVIQEAIDMGYNLVVAHHPIVFSGLKKFVGKTYVERVVIKAIKNDIAIIAIHTNLDNVIANGVNERIASRIGLKNILPLAIKKDVDQSDGPIGAGVIGELTSEIDEMDFLRYLKGVMGVNSIKYTKLLNTKIKKIAVCGGAGAFLLNDAINLKANVFITSDYKYHEFFDADNQIVIVDIGHYESEQYTIDLLQEIISRKFSTFAAHCTKVCTNPVNYL
ncbi:MAG: Nif3-like dinuclear metal center hexameric protein [Saprospiraceae bacterium]